MILTFLSPTVLSLALGILANNGLVPLRGAASTDTVLADTVLADTVLADTISPDTTGTDSSDSEYGSAAAKVCPYCQEGQCDVCYESYQRYEADFRGEGNTADTAADKKEEVNVDEANLDQAVIASRVNAPRPPEPIDTEDLSGDESSGEGVGVSDSDASSYDGDYSSHSDSVDDNSSDYHPSEYDSYPPQDSTYEPYDGADSDGVYSDGSYGYDYQANGYGYDGYENDGEYGDSYEDESYRESSFDAATGDNGEASSEATNAEDTDAENADTEDTDVENTDTTLPYENADALDLNDRQTYGEYLYDAEADYEPYGDDQDDCEIVGDDVSQQLPSVAERTPDATVAEWASESGNWIGECGRMSVAVIRSLWSGNSVRLSQVSEAVTCGQVSSDGRWIGCEHYPLEANSEGVIPTYLSGISQPLAEVDPPAELAASAEVVRPTLRLAARLLNNLGNAAINLSATLDQMAAEPSISVADRR